MSPDLLTWLLQFIQTQGLAVTLVIGAGLFVWRKLWPAVTDLVIPVWREARQAEVRLMERQVIAVERLANHLISEPTIRPKTGPK